MSATLAGQTVKDWALILLIVSVAFTFGVIGIGLVIAISSGAQITFTGTFDLSQYQTVLLGIAMVAVTLVAQQLTARQQSQMAKQTDQSWIDTEKEEKGTTK